MYKWLWCEKHQQNERVDIACADAYDWVALMRKWDYHDWSPGSQPEPPHCAGVMTDAVEAAALTQWWQNPGLY